MFRAITISFNSPFRPATLPPRPGSVEDENQSTRLCEEFTPTENTRKNPKLTNLFTFYGEAAVDIIAVHGLAGNRKTSWSVAQEDGNRYHWLREKLPVDLPVARILTLEYDTEWYKNPSHVDLEECGAQLLRCIAQERCHQGDLFACPARRKRPIIFIGHSFGGLVIKQALIYASQTHAWGGSQADFRSHQDIIACTAGIIFLGTPHRGSNFSAMAKAKMAAGSLVGYSTNPDLVSLLDLDSALLTYVHHQFSKLQKAERLKNLRMYCYFEEHDMPLIGKVVVKEDSACLDGVERRGLPLDHKQLNKFHPGEDENYKCLLTDISEVVKTCHDIVLPRFEAWQYNAEGCNSVRESTRRWLAPSQKPQQNRLKSRLADQLAASYTCQWIINLPVFESWKDWSNPQNVLWINGKAGSGKSVMAAFLINWFKGGMLDSEDDNGIVHCSASLSSPSCRQIRRSLTVLHFFCGIDRAHEDPASFVGTLIHQLLWQHNENERLVAMVQKVQRDHIDGAEPEILAKLLVALIKQVGNVIIIIDGLEEALQTHDEQEAYRHYYVKHLSFVNNIRNVRLLFLCQGIEEIHQDLIKTFDYPAIIPITDYSQPDIDQFIKIKVAELIQAKPNFGSKEQEIIAKLRSGAQGMFQWVSVSLKHLLKDVNDPKDIDKSLGDPSDGITDTYNKMFSRITKMTPGMQFRVKIALRWLSAPARPLTVLELKMATLLEENIEDALELMTKSRHDHAEVAQEFRALLEDLVQIDEVEDSVYTIQLAHDSLRISLTSEASLDKKDISPFKFTSEKAHRGCALACMKLVRQSAFSHANAFGGSQAPLVEYAWEFWTDHFKLSQASLIEPAFQIAFDEMIFDVIRDGISFLGALGDFASSPLERVPGVDGDLTYIVSLQHAQESILPSMEALQSVRLKTPLSEELQGIGERVARSTYSATSPETRIQEIRSLVDQNVSRFRINILKTKSAVLNLRVEEYLAKNPQLKSTVAPSVTGLWDAARKLRIVALRFAVNPVYGALIARAGGATFSPIHFLVYSASLLEECGNYPYWQHTLPSAFDLMDPFICKRGDPFAGAARFVLHSFEYRYPAVQEIETEPEIARQPSPKPTSRSRRARSHSPRPDPRDVGAYQTISAADRRRAQALQEMPGDKYITASVGYNMFHVEEGSPMALILNPLKNAHMDKVLMLKEEHELPQWVNLENPGQKLARHAPSSIQTSPVTQYIRSLPNVLRLTFARYFAAVAEVFGRFSQHALAQHFVRFETAKQELEGVKIYWQRLWNPDDPVKFWHLIPALFLFWLRRRFVPKFGHHHLPHPWIEFLYSYKHPAAYLDWQDTMTFWSWCKWILNYCVARWLTVYSLTVGLTLPAGMTRDAHNIVGSWSIICQLERSLFSMAFVLATMIASARVIFVDEESTAAVATFSFFYWINTFAGICIGCFQMGMLANVTAWWHVLMFAGSQLFLTVCWLYFSRIILRYLGRVLTATFSHLTWPIWIFVKVALQAYPWILKCLGIFLFVYCGFLAMYWTSRWMWDPYDTRASLSSLEDAGRIARSILQPTERKRIGRYPLGSTPEASLTGLDNPGRRPSGFRLSVRAPTLEREKEKIESEQQSIIPAMSGEEIFKVFFGAAGVPEAAQVGNSPATRSGGVSLQAREQVETRPGRQAATTDPSTDAGQNGEELSPEELFNRFFGKANDQPNGFSRLRRHSDAGLANGSHLKRE